MSDNYNVVDVEDSEEENVTEEQKEEQNRIFLSHFNTLSEPISMEKHKLSNKRKQLVVNSGLQGKKRNTNHTKSHTKNIKASFRIQQYPNEYLIDSAKELYCDCCFTSVAQHHRLLNIS